MHSTMASRGAGDQPSFLLAGHVGVVLDSRTQKRLDLLLEVALALFGPLHLAGQNYFAAGPLRHLDGQVLALVRRDPGDLDQVALVAGAGRRGREFDRVVHDAGDP